MSEKSSLMVPDGGYGWVVCGIAFTISLIADGIINSYGVFMPEIMKEFDCDSSTGAFIGSLQGGIMYFVAMFIFAMANKVGCRYVVKTFNIDILFSKTSLQNSYWNWRTFRWCLFVCIFLLGQSCRSDNNFWSLFRSKHGYGLPPNHVDCQHVF